MKYPLSEKYGTPELMKKIMGPNPVKLEEELLRDHQIPPRSVVCDLGSGQGLTSVFLAKEYGFRVYAADLWSEPEGNRQFFREMGVDGQVIPVKADAVALPFAPDFSTRSSAPIRTTISGVTKPISTKSCSPLSKKAAISTSRFRA